MPSTEAPKVLIVFAFSRGVRDDWAFIFATCGLGVDLAECTKLSELVRIITHKAPEYMLIVIDLVLIDLPGAKEWFEELCALPQGIKSKVVAIDVSRDLPPESYDSTRFRFVVQAGHVAEAIASIRRMAQ